MMEDFGKRSRYLCRVASRSREAPDAFATPARGRYSRPFTSTEVSVRDPFSRKTRTSPATADEWVMIPTRNAKEIAKRFTGYEQTPLFAFNPIPHSPLRARDVVMARSESYPQPPDVVKEKGVQVRRRIPF